MGAPFDSADEERGLAGLAHEFANLMQVVNGNLELLDARITEQPARRYLANTRAAADQLTELCRQLTARTRD